MFEELAEGMTNAGVLAKEHAIVALVKQRVEIWGNALVTCYERLQEAEKSVKRAKPDIKRRMADGQEVKEWSKEAWDRHQENIFKVASLKAAITKAFEKEDFSEVLRIAGGKKKAEKKDVCEDEDEDEDD
jgi:hypothetical protein